MGNVWRCGESGRLELEPDQPRPGRLVATVSVPVGLDDGVLNGGPIGVGRSVLAGRSVLDGVVPPFGVLATDGTRFAVKQDWFGMASMYVYRSHGVVAFSNRPMLLPYVFGDAIRPDPRASRGTPRAIPSLTAGRQ